MRLLLPEPLLPMKTVSGVNSTIPLLRTALKWRSRTLCSGSLGFDLGLSFFILPGPAGFAVGVERTHPHRVRQRQIV